MACDALLQDQGVARQAAHASRRILSAIRDDEMGRAGARRAAGEQHAGSRQVMRRCDQREDGAGNRRSKARAYDAGRQSEGEASSIADPMARAAAPQSGSW